MCTAHLQVDLQGRIAVLLVSGLEETLAKLVGSLGEGKYLLASGLGRERVVAGGGGFYRGGVRTPLTYNSPEQALWLDVGIFAALIPLSLNSVIGLSH
jgi:hypothetical protein